MPFRDESELIQQANAPDLSDTEGRSPELPLDYDIVDSENDLLSFHEISGQLLTSRSIFLDIYTIGDQASLRNQRYHRRITVLAAMFGTLAVIFAILQLTGFFPAPWPMWIEVLAASVAFVAVVLGLAQARQTQWLLQRHRAERCRLLKFQFLIEPDLWARNTAHVQQCEERYRGETQRILEMLPEGLHEWVKMHRIFDVPIGVRDCSLDGQTMSSLKRYYREKRLRVQMHYFSRRAKQYEGLDRFTRRIPPLLFFMSVVAVLGHFLLDIFYANDLAMHSASITLITLAASLPVLGAAIRTYRSAHEFARSASLFRAKYNALDNLNEQLDQEMECDRALRILWQCEQFLEEEHVEWMRLMLEADWFG